MIIKINPQHIQDKDLNLIKDYLEAGKVCILPTDTCYIMAANALDESAIKKVFAIKKRSLDKPIHVNVPSLKLAEKWVKIIPLAQKLADRFLPGPLTLVLPKKEPISDLLTAGKKTLGIRLPNHPLSLALAKILAIPYTTTSANISESDPAYSIDEVLKQLDKDKIDLIVDAGRLPNRPVSTILDLTVSPPQILREGGIGTKEIQPYLL
ncbi:threonylcarbamoyl-AMP synthase [Candidatus Beckwithbacteria bacterium RBG_13_42_9]|uniref:L-threonylcarbamoyladenylate synthase n=1 Tax=Candidatus Beckwithbacteria bacterium RBG_13_42_9 TaxID=1797457 RepID=A0A1F5E3T1_9BACT|nr:MAG: threonylcarbamoyl-AMP synthase [Candidatus Beckwithbacteria bacterium RBG_13_42_9]